MSKKETGNYVTIDLDHFLDGLDKALAKRHVTDRQLTILSDFEYARKNDREAHWYGPWSRVAASFLSPVCITPDNNTRIEGRAFSQHPATADASDLDQDQEVNDQAKLQGTLEDISIPSTRYVDYMVVALSHPNKLQSALVPLSQPDPRLVLGLELKNPKILGYRAQSPVHLKTLFSSVFLKQVVQQASHVFGSYRLGGDDAWEPKVFPSIIICGEWMTYVETTVEMIDNITSERHAAALALQEKREGSTYDPSDAANPRVAKATKQQQPKKTTAKVPQPARRGAGTSAPGGSGPKGSHSRKAKPEGSVHDDDDDDDDEDWAKDLTEDQNLDRSRKDKSEDGTWIVRPGHSVKAQLQEIFTDLYKPVELTGPSGWKALSLIAQRLTESDVSGDMFPRGTKIMDRCHFDGYEEFNLLKSWMMREAEWAKNKKKAYKGR